jgi:hypothetical protein
MNEKTRIYSILNPDYILQIEKPYIQIMILFRIIIATKTDVWKDYRL